MNSKIRQQVFEKYNGLCAYTGKPLGDDWQVDHMTSKYMHQYKTHLEYGSIEEVKLFLKKVDDVENLMPAIKIINHYKRSLDLEGFRDYMLSFHKRLKKLPKKTVIHETQRRKEYMLKVAELFDITPDKPFCGRFYFETQKQES